MPSRQWHPQGVASPVPVYTVATIPTADSVPANTLVYVADAPEGDRFAISDGASWLYPAYGVTNYLGQVPDAPTIVGVGAKAEGSGSGPHAAGLPAGVQEGDLLLLYGATETTRAFSAGAGWAAVPDSPQDAARRLTVLWKRAGAGEAAAGVSSVPGGTTLGGIIAVRGTPASGNPWDVTAGATDAADNASQIPTDTTTIPNALVLMATSTWSFESLAPGASVVAAGLADPVITMNYGTLSGTDAGLVVATGVKVDPGPLGAMTINLTQASQGADPSKGVHLLTLKGV
jgi:hypothetical protein